MASEEHRYLPNDFTVEIRFKPNPRMLDHRGDWAARLCERLDLPKWVIADNIIDIHDEPTTQRAIIAYNRCALTMIDVGGCEVFTARAAKLLTCLFELPDFGTRLWVYRLGVKPRFCTPFDGAFEQLLKQVKDRYFDLKTEAHEAVVSSATLVDIGAVLEFRDDCGDFKSQCGAMKRQQSKAIMDYRKEDDLPLVGFYYEIDYFIRPDKDMQDEEITGTVDKFGREGWLRHQRIRRLIVRS